MPWIMLVLGCQEQALRFVGDLADVSPEVRRRAQTTPEVQQEPATPPPPQEPPGAYNPISVPEGPRNSPGYSIPGVGKKPNPDGEFIYAD